MARVNITKNGTVEGYLTVSEASKKLRKSVTAVRKLIRDGELPAVKLYNIYIIREKDVLPKKRKNA